MLIGICLVVSFVLLPGCPAPSHRARQESQVASEPVSSEAVTVARKAEPNLYPDSVSDLFGTWAVAGSSCPGICAMSHEEAESWIGLTATLADSELVFGGYSCRDATYRNQQLSKRDFFRSTRFDLVELGILMEEVQKLTVACEGQEWIAPGGILYVKDRQTLIVPWDGVYFELKRAQAAAD